MNTVNTEEAAPISEVLERLLKELSALKVKIQILETRVKFEGIPNINLDVDK